MFVKICGITNEEDALLAVAMGTDAIGFVFAPSKRQIAYQQVRDIARRLPPEVLTFGVFRDELPSRVVEIIGQAGLRGAQLHGRETPDQTQWVKERVPVVFKAFAAGDPSIAKADLYGADAILIDGMNPGSGEVYDWALAADAPGSQRLVLAGGLTPENVASAIRRVHPWGVDVSSGVEESPGRKDPRKLRAFIASVRSTESDIDDLGTHKLSDSKLHDIEGPYDWQEDD